MMSKYDVISNVVVDAIASRLASKDTQASRSLMDEIVSQSEVARLSSKVDEQTYDLMVLVYRKLSDRLKLDSGEQEALNRLKMSLGSNYSEAMHRNNIFKAAHALGLKLPSSMF